MTTNHPIPTPAAHTQPVLTTLLTQAQQFPPEYRGGLSSHLPMALHAMAELGAGDDALRRFFSDYSTRFGASRHEALRAEAWPDWQRHLGEGTQFSRFEAHFAHALDHASQEAVMRQALPMLWPGLSGAALHGLIRVGHAWQSAHTAELASALAYWAAVCKPLPEQAHAPALSLAAWWSAVQAAAKPRQHNFISTEMRAAAQTEEYRALRLDLPAPPADLAEAIQTFARCAAAHYAASRNFTVLHLVTGSRAILALLPLLELDAEQSAAPISSALTAALLTTPFEREIALPALNLAPEAAASIRAMFHAALGRSAGAAVLDDHVIKLVHACWTFARLRPDGAFVQAAQQALGPAACTP